MIRYTLDYDWQQVSYKFALDNYQEQTAGITNRYRTEAKQIQYENWLVWASLKYYVRFYACDASCYSAEPWMLIIFWLESFHLRSNEKLINTRRLCTSTHT